ncbi:MAG TPA: Holliday junction branch migration protein RuvA [Anaerolineae bacterium]|nr:Holliday junction branch migration protein RuvA [Anaerolineae bacterium]
MIARLHGTVESIGRDSLIVSVGGVGFKVRASAAARELAGKARTIELFTHMLVRENEISLYGFVNEEELALFELLLGVSGIGPKAALSILSSAPPERLRQAIASGEIEVFTRVPGIGPKTAQTIVFHLKDKVGVAPSAPAGQTAFANDDIEIVGALTALGYSVAEAQAALASVPRESGATTEERLRLALAYFARP